MNPNAVRRGPARPPGLLAVLARRRRPIGAACAALAVAGAVLLLRPPAPPTTEVLVAARDLTALEPLGDGDTAVRAVPRDTVPAGALGPSENPAGNALTAPVRRGEVLTTARIADPPAAAYGAGMVAAPVRVADPGAVALLRPGSRVDVLAAAQDPLAAEFGAAPAAPAEVVVRDRPVIAVPGADPGGGESGALLLLAVTEEESRSLAGRAVADRLSITIRG
ncbi:SAF domain-containing protein [Marinitenerispora sediminis]|uniref:Flp pilus assembly protein CpaB n=1 Tax=Marinitenerispora sediminis TaxID=1931232 RepID=A0A368TBF2_9ACTN|nr:SAF domain-containing protein [Marinitenerispora sediminis]RCV57098.1 Flp pilus assembly protein CpaB [Marinitenerispora sediminis]RCV58907.1 Flp pilus assembly protein CpaB [Marinitenerispora sediminis]RCV62173.1 Flp pilus assembly protein CpaB [Marinitenerispora sediminis]